MADWCLAIVFGAPESWLSILRVRDLFLTQKTIKLSRLQVFGFEAAIYSLPFFKKHIIARTVMTVVDF